MHAGRSTDKSLLREVYLAVVEPEGKPGRRIGDQLELAARAYFRLRLHKH